MKTTYLIWQNPSCSGINPDWKKINGKDFLALVRSPEGKGRYFIKLASTESDGSDGTVVMEATEATYQNWKREKNHSDYLRNLGKTVTVISYHSLKSDEDDCYGEELLANPNSEDTELLNALALELALASLTEAEYKLIEFLYLSDKPGTVRGYEEMTGIPKTTVSRRQKVALDKLKKYFSD